MDGALSLPRQPQHAEDGEGRPGLELLRLLAEDAPAADLERVALALAADDPQVAARARELALRVRGVLDAHRRREAELSALVDTARDLASLREPSGVLDAIVRRARALVGTDVAYLTLHDPEAGDTYMRATAGSVSARFQTVRLSLGAGLGGLVAQTRRPYWTADYFADARFRHTATIDDAVQDEGLVAICGTPLLVEDEFVGVLFASNRSRRPFTHDEVALLGSLATLAAVTLTQIRSATEVAQALRQLSAAHETVRRHTAGVERAADAHDRFTTVVLEGGGPEDLASALADHLGGWVVLLDADGHRLAERGQAPRGSAEEALASDPAVAASALTGRLAHVDGTWAVAVSASGVRLGTLLLRGPGDLDDADRRTVERAALVTALVLLFRRQAAEAEQRVRTDLLADLLAAASAPGAPAPSGLARRAALLGLDLRRPHVLAVCRSEAADDRSALALRASAAVAGRGLSGEHDGDVVVLLEGEDAGAVASRLAAELSRGGGGRRPVTVGAAGPVLPLQGLRGACAEARRTVAALAALGARGRGASVDQLGFAGLVVGGAPDVQRWTASVLGPLLDHDERRGSDLVTTVEAWFAAGGSPRRAARALHVHPNTVAQRLERVRSLLGADWAAPERALELQLALRMRHLVGAVGRGTTEEGPWTR